MMRFRVRIIIRFSIWDAYFFLGDAQFSKDVFFYILVLVLFVRRLFRFFATLIELKISFKSNFFFKWTNEGLNLFFLSSSEWGGGLDLIFSELRFNRAHRFESVRGIISLSDGENVKINDLYFSFRISQI